MMTELQVVSSEKNISERVPLLPPRSDSTSIDIDEVFFLVGTQAERIRCRRKTLTSTSPVFGSIITDAIHNGKDQEVIELPDVQPEHFRNFVKYVEGNEHFTNDSFTLEEVAEVFKIAKAYSVNCLQKKCREFFRSARSADNVITIYQCAQDLDEPELEADLCAFITSHFVEVLRSKDFVNLSYSNLCHFLKLDEIAVKEVEIFLGTYRWAEAECCRQALEVSPTNIRAVLQSALHLFRFPLMTLPEFSAHVIPKEILRCEEVDAITAYMLTDYRKPDGAPQIFPLINKRRGLAQPKTYTVHFYECLVFNSEVWQGKWMHNIIKVNRPVSIVGFEFDGPIKCDAMYYVKMKLVEIGGESSENFNQVPMKEDVIHAKKQRTFFVSFDNPVPMKPDVFYKAHYALQGPKTIWGVQPRNQVRLFCDEAGNVVFTFQCVDGQVPGMRFVIP